jgi:hypothetical protein
MSDYPFIGCSVDGIISCKCHGKKVFEIKCPFSSRHLHPKEVAVQKGCSIVGNTFVVTEKIRVLPSDAGSNGYLWNYL